MTKYRLEIEVFEGNAGPAPSGNLAQDGVCAWLHHGGVRVGDRFDYPADSGKMCPWLLDSVRGFARVLMYGGELPWTYAGTPYEKVCDQEGVTTEFVRCPDPASPVVVKLIRTRVEE
jgi:uncharacterized repeat protein (TIGR04076 family)